MYEQYYANSVQVSAEADEIVLGFKVGCYLYSAKFVWPVSLACVIASLSPTRPRWHAKHRSVKLLVSVNCLALFASRTTS
mmetsp:Transcript_31018/g.77377  ORF Transcript_31018/g.77377 Transcript_31018/m.77377 type:complete len:80 (+) Transcript_31018:225-464(+)